LFAPASYKETGGRSFFYKSVKLFGERFRVAVEAVRRACSDDERDYRSIFMRSKNFLVLLIVFGLIFIFSVIADAQELKTERVVSSNIVRVWLPSGAEKILPESIPAEMTAMVEKIVAEKGQGKWKLYDTEVLIWKGANFKKTGAPTIINRLTERIKTAEWQYKQGKTEKGMTIFIVQEDATGNVVVGFYIATPDGLIWAWTLVAPKA